MLNASRVLVSCPYRLHYKPYTLIPLPDARITVPVPFLTSSDRRKSEVTSAVLLGKQFGHPVAPDTYVVVSLDGADDLPLCTDVSISRVCLYVCSSDVLMMPSFLIPSRDFWILMPRRDFHFRKNEPSETLAK